jgi:aspartyl-tRNA synthetase
MTDEADRSLLRRTVGCGELGPADAERGRSVVLTGWVHRRRDLGRLIFVELRDASGSVQVVFDPSEHAEAHRVAESLRIEYVIGVAGVVVPRESPNPSHATGTIEVRAERAVLHNRADAVPFPVGDDEAVNEEARLTHRYVDLRRPRLQKNLRTRHRLAAAARAVLDRHGFIEIETPILTRSTPEGARDYLVPSRIHAGSCYALPQSPQLFKQLLMVAGFDKYYQIARCFRDEDLRADRQPEFTQIDIEMSFVRPEDVYEVVEEILVRMFAEVGVVVSRPFPRLAYDEALERFGTDRPDTRFALELADPGPAAAGGGFRVFDEALAAGGAVRGVVVPGGAAATRRDIDRWTELARGSGARGLVWIKLEASGATSPALKALGAERCAALAGSLAARPGDLVLLVADRLAVCRRVLGTLRTQIASERGLVDTAAHRLLWVERFPLFEWDETERRWAAMHHPFTAPRWEELGRLEDDPARVRSQAYDIVLDGVEIGGGSIRIHRRDVQDRVFRVLGIDAEQARTKFGFLLQALDSGAPPHGGIALGFDRICALLCGADSIREVIAFPKTTSATCLMTRSPAPVDERQLRELHLRTRQGEQNE